MLRGVEEGEKAEGAVTRSPMPCKLVQAGPFWISSPPAAFTGSCIRSMTSSWLSHPGLNGEYVRGLVLSVLSQLDSLLSLVSPSPPLRLFLSRCLFLPLSLPLLCSCITFINTCHNSCVMLINTCHNSCVMFINT